MFLLHQYQDTINHSLSKRQLSERQIGAIVGIVIFAVGWIIAFVFIFLRRRRQPPRMQYQEPTVRYGMPQQQQEGYAPPAPRPNMSGNARDNAAAAGGQTNRTEIPDDFVPPYSETADESKDMGYYDAEGKFHSIDYTKPPLPPSTAHTR
ncbi:hypothetical protein Cantr_02729 [Candida viswanathii]|uniref:Protein RCR2 n=1 Tax=Candida viswanathii TaxID=5486 RepID=A0A367YLH3_9ASCO|nr:hypothetical protein Cantr_02729 [Candida viswanathii]